MNTETVTILDRVCQIIESNYVVPKVTAESNLADDLDFDSLDKVELTMFLEEEFEVKIDDDDADNIHTVQQIVDHLAKLGVPS